MAKKSNESTNPYICPFCFSTIDFRNVHYQCTNPSCTKEYLRNLTGADLKKYSCGKNDAEVDVEKTIFLGNDPKGSDVAITKQHIIRNSGGMCEICKRPVYIKLCPVCHYPIPQGAEEEGNSVFVILGPKGVGKSHYIAVLINQLMQSFTKEFDYVMNPATDKTTLVYRDTYFKRLYEDGRKLSPTLSYEESKDSREPLIYHLRSLNDEHPKVYTLAFFDTAGEDLVSENKMMGLNLNSFISRASGIVFLVDPLQIPYVNNRICIENKPDPNGNMADILSNIAKIIRNNNKLKQKDRIQIPLAIALTKTDVLIKPPENEEEEKILLGLNSSIHVDRERGTYDAENFEQISVEIEEYLRRAISNGFVQSVKDFEKHCYFAVSALGSNPTGSVLSRGISPMRIEDPFIWLLLNNDKEKNR